MTRTRPAPRPKPARLACAERAVISPSSSSLSRTEKGQQSVSVHLVRSMLDLYDVGGERWTELIELTREARKHGWWRAYGLDDTGYVPLEAEATQVRLTWSKAQRWIG